MRMVIGRRPRSPAWTETEDLSYRFRRVRIALDLGIILRETPPDENRGLARRKNAGLTRLVVAFHRAVYNWRSGRVEPAVPPHRRKNPNISRSPKVVWQGNFVVSRHQTQVIYP